MPFYGFDPANYPLNTNEWAFPVCEILHILGMAVLLGTIMIVDLRMLGLGMRRQTTAELAKDTAPWTMLGLAMILISGPLIMFSDPGMYVAKPVFQWKMYILLAAIIYNWTIHRSVANSATPSGAAPIVAAISILLWGALPFYGIFIAFI